MLLCRHRTFQRSVRLFSSSRVLQEQTLPSQARCVVIGGGIIGNSVAYHLARRKGFEDIVLLERDRLTSGTTWHAAGLMVTFGSTSETSTEFRKYTRHLYSTLAIETGLETGFLPIGFIELATNEDRLEEFRRVAAFNRMCGVDVEEISPAEVKELWPLCKTDDVLAGFYVKGDGRVNPVDATMSLAKGARMKGARIYEGVPVASIDHEGGRVKGVTTVSGHAITAEYVINCTGAWARELGEQAGVVIPLQAAEHYYMITESMPNVKRSWPVIEDPSSYGYYREEGGGLMVGLFEPKAAAWNINGIPKDFSFGEIEPDWERVSPFLERAMSRVPAAAHVGIKKLFCGPESFTPDLSPIVGEAPTLRNYWVAAGMNSIGILTGGGIGRCVADWIAYGDPGCDVTGINIDRFHKYQLNPEYRRKRTEEALGLVYQCHYPYKGMQSARGVKKSPFYDCLSAAGAYFKDVSGWEGADWFAPTKMRPSDVFDGTHSWGRESWFPLWEAEHNAARNEVALIDMSFMSKFLVQGPDAGVYLDYISANNVNGELGTITYTQWLNEQGKLEADVTVTKLDSQRFMVVVTDTMHGHAEAWLRKHIPARKRVEVVDVTESFGQLNLQGPRARDILRGITSTDVSNEAFPFRGVREIDIGLARVSAARITYVGELGYELYVPAAQAAHVYERVVEAGRDVGLRHAGLKALGSLRMEKGYRDYGHDMDNTDTIIEVGLGFAVQMDKEDFIGKEAVAAMKADGIPHKRLLQVFANDPSVLLYKAEPVIRNGEPAGYVRSASYGHTLGGAVGLAMLETKDGSPLTRNYINEGKWELDIAGTRVPATVSLTPLYDPKNKRIKV